MKKLFLLFCLSLYTIISFSQVQNPVQWSYSATKKSSTSYEVTIVATVPKPWHIYSQTTPKGGPIPTKITFAKNPLVVLTGNAQEVGSLQVDHDKNFGIDVKYFSDKVEFVQTVNLKAPVKTNVSGIVEYMVCNDSQCLPPTKVNFEVKLQ